MHGETRPSSTYRAARLTRIIHEASRAIAAFAASRAPAPSPDAAPGDGSAGRAVSGNSASGSDQSLAARLAAGGHGWTLLAFFGVGILLSFTPCVLPMVPIPGGVIVGSGARRRRRFTLALAFVLPIAITYAVLGVATALAGANLQALLQSPPVLVAFALIFVVLALAMFGAFELQLPEPLRERLSRASQRRRGGHLGGAAALGVVSALLVGPCMTALLAGALLYIANTGNAVLGGAALLSLGLGMGVPLVIVGTAGAQFLPRPGPWMNAVKGVFGFVLLGTALMLGLWGALLLAIGLALWKASARLRTDVLTTAGRAAALLAGLWGGMMLVGAAGGADTPLHPLRSSIRSARWR